MYRVYITSTKADKFVIRITPINSWFQQTHKNLLGRRLFCNIKNNISSKNNEQQYWWRVVSHALLSNTLSMQMTKFVYVFAPKILFSEEGIRLPCILRVEDGLLEMHCFAPLLTTLEVKSYGMCHTNTRLQLTLWSFVMFSPYLRIFFEFIS